MNDTAALAQLREGDLNALGWIYKQHKQHVVRQLQRCFQGAGVQRCSTTDAEDVFQSVCLELHKKVAQEKGLTELYGGGLGGWLFQTARNIWMAQVRKSFKETQHFTAFLEQSNLKNENAPIEDLAYWHKLFFKTRSVVLKQTPGFQAFLQSLGLNEKKLEGLDAIEVILEKLVETLQQLGSPCKDLLHHYHIEGLSFEAILEKMPNYANYDSLKKERWRCMERLRRLLNL